ncbi:MAG: lipoate--protein ligase family protein [Thermoplasmata archaeon]
MKFRVIVDSYHDAATNMAIDEAILRSRKSKDFNTLRLYHWDPSAVSIGYFQSIFDEINMEYAEKNRISVIRRITGGGAVYHDHKGDLTYSIIVDPSFAGITNLKESYTILSSGLLEGLIRFGINAKFEGINDISVNNKKISGNAQTRRFGSVLQHGTLLLSVNPELMFSVLKVDNEKMKDKLIKNVYERVTSIEKELGEFDISKLKNSIVEGYKTSFSEFEFIAGTLDQDEVNLIEPIRKERYLDRSWNFKK